MKNFILSLCSLFLVAHQSHAANTKCLKQVDQEIKRFNMGSLEHPGACVNKSRNNPEDSSSEQYTLTFSYNSSTVIQDTPFLIYSSRTTANSEGPSIIISSPDIMGVTQYKEVMYDNDCKTIKVVFYNAKGKVAELNKTTCQKGNSKEKPFDQCKLYEFSNVQTSGYTLPPNLDDKGSKKAQ